MSAVSTLVGLVLLLGTTVCPAEAQLAAPHHHRRLHQAGAAPAPVGQVCSNGLVCPEHQRCDTTLLSGNDGTQAVIQCLCVTGYNGSECPKPFTVPPAPTDGPVAPLRPAAVAPAPVGQVCSNGLVCPERQRCDTTLLSGNDGTQAVIQCLCVTGYNGPECPKPYTVPPPPTTAPVAPAPPTSTASSAAAAAATVASPGSSSSAPKGGSSGLGVGAIVGIVVGCVLGVGLLAAGVLYGMRRRREERKAVEFQDFHHAHHSMDSHQQPAAPTAPEA
ncbi:hypothetical protein KFL_000010820 [Klebsormidium nitens]|uniref:EGF-like domain-containing protein n=1 Tax=Klebsormidium nitens TaxID=105231 RepID=A0A0U9HHY2_KLENI|nr:hypothetical protein KFL_000010820 [Klebsormidium nitens]|eukprot:GAQ77634.1 hypothetical protein KFL_000010820 [Klebsormidium nitens]